MYLSLPVKHNLNDNQVFGSRASHRVAQHRVKLNGAIMASPEDLVAKQQLIESFFNDLQKRADFTTRLMEDGNASEAMLLCCCYIEALGNWLDGSGSIGMRNFAVALKNHSGEPIHALILQTLLTNALPLKSAAPSDRSQLNDVMAKLPQYEAFTEAELMEVLSKSLSPTALVFVRNECWRATVAAATYSRVRSLGAHWLGTSRSLTFSKATYKGSPLPEIGFTELRQALDRIIAHARQLSLSTNKWFGQSTRAV